MKMVLNPPEYNDMDYFPIYGSFNGDSQVNAVNFNYILRTGDIPALEMDWLSELINGPNQNIDIYAQDSFNCSLDNIKNRVLDALHNHQVISPKIQKLLNDRHWNKAEREEYEQILAETVSKIVNETPGFEQYRSKSEKGNEDLARPVKLNDLSDDMNTRNKGRYKFELECKAFSAIEGCVLQMVENGLLAPYKTDDKTSWKRPLSYFRSGGLWSFNNQSAFKSHAWIITPTGNVIESTNDPDNHLGLSPYCRTNASLEVWARGSPIYGKGYGSVYEIYSDGKDGKIDNTYRHTPPAHNHNFSPHISTVTFSKNRAFAIEQRKTSNGNAVVVAYQKMDVGTPDERYVPIDVRLNQKLDETYKFEYKDVLGDHTYRFTADKNGTPKIERYNHNASYFNGSYWNWENITASVDIPENSAQDTRTGFRENILSNDPETQTSEFTNIKPESPNTQKLS